MSMLRIVFLGLLATTMFACSGESDSSSGDQDGAQDINQSADDIEPNQGDVIASSGVVCPTDHVTLNLSIDDSANATYGEGELIWTGSFAYDEATNTVAYATAWGITDGPYPYLYDDGPISEGGHEPEGATAGDHIWGASVCYLAEQDRAIAYGLLNDDLRWIWVGPNGLLDVPAGTTGVIDAPGMIIPAHGDRDFEVQLDLNALSEDYATISLETHKVYLKGTMNAWTPVQLLDGGFLGDEAEGDGVVTYRHSFYLSKHTGLLQPGQEAQFVFVFATGDLDPDLALEYKTDGDAELSGVSAKTLCVAGWADAEVVTSLDSKGLAMNTAVTLCPEDPEGSLLAGDATQVCTSDEDCAGEQTCVEGSCTDATRGGCTEMGPCPEDTVCQAGQCIPADGPAAECDDMTACPEGEVCVAGACVLAPEGDCNDQVPCTGPGEVCLDGQCVTPDSQPELSLVIPALGASTGGTMVTLLGSGFVVGSTVTFGGTSAEILTLEDNQIEVLTPAQTIGMVDVVVTSPDGGFSLYPDGFTYVEADQAPLITSVTPDSGSTEGGTEVMIAGANFIQGAVVRFGAATASWAEVLDGGTMVRAPSPAQPVGSVDVTVTNPDNQSASLTDGFTYTPNQIDWGRMLTADTIELYSGAPLEVQAELYEPGLTPGEGAGLGIIAEVAWAAEGSNLEDEASWSSIEAAWVADAANDGGELNNDIVGANLTLDEGSWVVAVRVRLNADQPWLWLGRTGPVSPPSAAACSTVMVTAAPAVTISSVTPAVLFPFGGGIHALEGVGLSIDCTASIEAVSACDEAGSLTVELVDNMGVITFESPSGGALCGLCGCTDAPALLSLACPLGTASAELATPGWDGDTSKWPAELLLAESIETSAWGENALTSLYATADDSTLVIGVAGQVVAGDFGSNAIVGYLDIDPGAGTGVSATSEITDLDGAVDASLGGDLQFAIDGFGAEVAFATLDMASSDLPDRAGWRNLTTPSDLGWFTEGTVNSSNNGVEAYIPLSTLFPEGPIGQLRTVAVVVRVTNANGDAFSNQGLPQAVSGDMNQVSTEAVTFTVDY